MRRHHIDEDIRPLSEFRANASACIQHVNATKRPLVITQHGRGAVVVQVTFIP
jgi:prevent-host-death family protein